MNRRAERGAKWGRRAAFPSPTDHVDGVAVVAIGCGSGLAECGVRPVSLRLAPPRPTPTRAARSVLAEPPTRPGGVRRVRPPSAPDEAGPTASRQRGLTLIKE